MVVTMKEWKEITYTIPFNEIVKAISQIKYATQESVMFQMLVYTGCRIVELDKMKKTDLHGHILRWKLGKLQKKWRHEPLPEYYIEELKEYWRLYPTLGNEMFGILGKSFRRSFNCKIRPILKCGWTTKRPEWQWSRPDVKENIWQLKGLRKNFQTLIYAQQLDKWRDSGVALEFTSKRMKHKSTKITAYHYIQNFDGLGIDEVKHLSMQEIYKTGRQKRIFEFA